MPKSLTVPSPGARGCPQCGAPLQHDPACRVVDRVARFGLRDRDASRERSRLAPALLCSGCEYCVELTCRCGATELPPDHARSCPTGRARAARARRAR